MDSTSGTASTLQVHCRDTAGTLLLHCKYTAVTLQLAVYTANTLQNGLLWQHFCTCSLHCSYTAYTLHFGLGSCLTVSIKLPLLKFPLTMTGGTKIQCDVVIDCCIITMIIKPYSVCRRSQRSLPFKPLEKKEGCLIFADKQSKVVELVTFDSAYRRYMAWLSFLFHHIYYPLTDCPTLFHLYELVIVFSQTGLSRVWLRVVLCKFLPTARVDNGCRERE